VLPALVRALPVLGSLLQRLLTRFCFDSYSYYTKLYQVILYSFNYSYIMIYPFIPSYTKIACKDMVKSSESTTKTALVDPSNTEESDVTDFKIIKVSPETHKKLLKLGSKGETFDNIINRLIKEHEQRHG
jgi:hypothetical protein